MTVAWYIYYGLKLGLTLDQTMFMPWSTLLDLIAVYQIKEEGFEYVPTLEDDQEEVMRLLSIK